jgi:trans-AT polyketide synthase, acyltransferase and oxidoreductase domains
MSVGLDGIATLAPPAGRPRLAPLGWWRPHGGALLTGRSAWRDALADLGRPLVFVQTADGPDLADGGSIALGPEPPAPDAYPVAAVVPACQPEQLGDPSFCADHGLRYPYVTGAMANGIGSAEIVEAMSRAGMLGFFGAAGLPLPQVEAAVDRITRNLGSAPFGFNLIHTPGEPAIEEGVVELYLRRGVRLAEASAYLDLTPAVVRYRVSGLHRGPDGRVVAPNRIIAKVSRVEVASKFFAPPPERWLKVLRDRGQVTEQEAELARQVPMAQDVTAEADSGGHTDNRPAICLIPTLLALRGRM